MCFYVLNPFKPFLVIEKPKWHNGPNHYHQCRPMKIPQKCMLWKRWPFFSFVRYTILLNDNVFTLSESCYPKYIHMKNGRKLCLVHKTAFEINSMWNIIRSIFNMFIKFELNKNMNRQRDSSDILFKFNFTLWSKLCAHHYANHR